MRTIKEPVLAAWMNDHVDEKIARHSLFHQRTAGLFRADHRRAYCGAGSPAGVHTLGAGLYRFLLLPALFLVPVAGKKRD